MSPTSEMLIAVVNEIQDLYIEMDALRAVLKYYQKEGALDAEKVQMYLELMLRGLREEGTSHQQFVEVRQRLAEESNPAEAVRILAEGLPGSQFPGP